MTAPITPTDDEVRAAEFKWEYDQVSVDVSTMADPPDSVMPLRHIRRRIVSQWEVYDDSVNHA